MYNIKKGGNNMAGLVIYKNELNTVPLRNFNSKEMDLFFVICSKMRDEGLREIKFTFEELKELSDYKYTAYDRFVKDIEGVYDKLIQLNIKIGTATEFTKFALFTRYSVSAESQTVEIKANEDFKEILNNLTSNFTKFELTEFVTLRSSYSKTAYRLLKQFRKTGYYIVSIDEFRRLFDVPLSYQIGNIDQKILSLIENELPQYFKNLKITKLKGKGKRKRFIENIEFKFTAESDVKDGKKTFRDADGNYYEKDLLKFTDKEIAKTFPEVKPVSDYEKGEK
jgi:plasmid replication initiation protein